jgi:putative endonuclease
MLMTNSSTHPPVTHLELGQWGEVLAALYLKKQGYQIIARNVTLPLGRTPEGTPITGELDIVALDGQTLVFVEVKTRSSDQLALPEAAVTPAKQRKLARTARRYRRLIGPIDMPYRFDVVSIVASGQTEPQLRLLKDFFQDRVKNQS